MERPQSMQVRGDILFFLRHYVERNFGVEGYGLWLESLPSESRSILGPRLEVSSWYPAEDSLAVPLERICALFHEGDKDGAMEFGRDLADHLSRGKRIVMKMDLPENVLRREGGSVLTFCGPGLVEAPLAAPCMAILRFWRFQGMSPVLENMLGGYLEKLAEHSGGLNAHYQVSASLSQGSPYSELVLTWD